MCSDTKAEWQGKVPFTADGHMLNYAGAEMDHWREQKVWRDSLRLDRWDKMGVPHFVLVSQEDNTEYVMEPEWFMDAFNHAKVLDGQMWGYWTFTGKGGHYSIKLVEE